MNQLNPFADAEQIALLLTREAKTSLGKAIRIMLKLATVSALGFVLASNCCLSSYLVPVGVIALAIAAGWLEVIREECKNYRFFPSTNMNIAGGVLFHWRWLAIIAVATFTLSSASALRHLQLELFVRRLWSFLKYGCVPLVLMLIGRTLEPFRFRSAQAEIQKAEMLVRQLVYAQKFSDISAMTPLIMWEDIPLYKLGSVAALLNSVAASMESTQKLAVDLSKSIGPKRTSLLSMMYAPFRELSSRLFLWESRDMVLFIVVAAYLALVYVGSYYFPWTPLCILVPFVAPKSRTGRFCLEIEQDIRLAQGAAVEKKYGLTSAAVGPTQAGTKPIYWDMVAYFVMCHFWAVYCFIVVFVYDWVCPIVGQGMRMKWETTAWALLLYVCSALGITAGAHRYWAHRSYRAAWPLRALLLVFNSIANQGCIYNWAADHRVHHLYSDTDADPYDATRGFFFSHMGWLFTERSAANQAARKRVNTEDLDKDPLVRFQRLADPFWNLAWCFGFPSFVVLAWGDTLWNGFLLAGMLRYVALLHATWAVNSVVHRWGTKPYNAVQATTENGWVSFFAIGEGWHNWHHAFCFDYACAELGAAAQFNPTKVFIDFMAFLGLAWDRKRALEAWAQRKAKWAEQSGRPVLESMEGPLFFRRRVVSFGANASPEVRTDGLPNDLPYGHAEDESSKE